MCTSPADGVLEAVGATYISQECFELDQAARHPQPSSPGRGLTATSPGKQRTTALRAMVLR